MKLKFLNLLITLCSLADHALSQDVLNYYIVYDASGSVHTIDKKDNLQNSLLQLLGTSREKEREYDQAISFLLVPFGEDTTVRRAITYGNSRDTEKLFQKVIIDKTQKSRRQRHSDIHAGLKMVLDSLNLNKTNTPSGVFVFTDGHFIEKDIANPSRTSGYKDSVDSLILAIEKKVGPGKIFYIQTSPYNPQFQFSNLELKPKEAVNNVLKDSCLYSKNYFWIAAGVSVDSPGYKQHLEQFIYNANIAIITPNELPLKNEREVAITLQEIFTLHSRLQTGTKKEFKNIELLIKEIGDLINQPTLSPDEMETLQLAMKQLSLNSNIKTSDIDKQKSNTKSAKAFNILSILNDVNGNIFISYRDSLLQLIQNNPTKQEKQQTLASIALTESYKPVATTLLTNEVKQNKGWENLEQNLINGTANYLVKRAKQEVVYSFLDNLNRYFKNDNIRRSYMLAFFPTVWQYTENRNALPDVMRIRDAFKKDIRKLPETIYNNDTLIKNPSMLTLWVFMRFYDQLLSTGNLEYTFDVLASEMRKIDTPKYDTSYLKQSIKLSLNLLSYLNNNDIAAVYSSHNRDSIIKLSKLLYILSIDAASLQDSSIIVYNLEHVSKIVSKIYSDYEIAKKQIQILKNLLSQSPVSDFEGFRKYHRDLLLDILHRSATLITSGAEIIASQALENWKHRQLEIKAEALTSKHCNLKHRHCEALRQIKATTVVNEQCKLHIHCIDTIIGTSEIEKMTVQNRNIIYAAQNGIEAWFNIQNENYKEAMFNLFSASLTFTNKNKNLYNILLISGEIASAKDAEEISDVLSKSLLPVASYTTKRNNTWSFMVNAYLGAGANFYKHDGPKLAVHAPIGLEFSKNISICKSYNWNSSISIMATLLDVGNVIRYNEVYTNEDSGNIASFARIFSPGAILSLGISNKIPIAIIGGYHFNPRRFMVGLGLDLPLAGIWKDRRQNTINIK